MSQRTGLGPPAPVNPSDEATALPPSPWQPHEPEPPDEAAPGFLDIPNGFLDIPNRFLEIPDARKLCINNVCCFKMLIRVFVAGQQVTDSEEMHMSAWTRTEPSGQVVNGSLSGEALTGWGGSRLAVRCIVCFYINKCFILMYHLFKKDQ